MLVSWGWFMRVSMSIMSLNIPVSLLSLKLSPDLLLLIFIMYVGSWFAWANSIFAQTILDLARRKPHLLFGKDAEPYIIE